MTKPIKAWWFGNTLRYDDGRVAEKNAEHSIGSDETPECCSCGMHASVSLCDALRYANGCTMLWRVEISGDVDKGDNKISGRHRRYLAGCDVEKVLRRFACDCALDVLPDDAPPIILRYLTEMREEDRRAAYRAADWAAYRAAYRAEQMRKYKIKLTAMVRAEFKRQGELV